MSNAKHIHKILCCPPTITTWVCIFLFTCAYLKANIDHVVGWHAFFNFWGKRVMLSLFHPGQWQTLLKGFYCCHLVQLLQGVPLYLSYNHIPSIWITSLQYWNPLIHSLKLQKDDGISRHSTIWPPYGGINSVPFSTTISKRNCYIACSNLGKSWINFFALS